MTGHYNYLVAERERVLSTARISAADRARIMGLRQYAPIIDKVPPVVPDPNAQLLARPPVAPRIRVPEELSLSGRGGGGGRYGGGLVLVQDMGTVSARARDVIDVCASVWQVDVFDILSFSRKRKFARPRQAAMAIMAKFLKLSTTSIGKIFGRDHTTVTWAVLHQVPGLTGPARPDRGFLDRYAYAQRKLRRLWAVQ